MKYLGMKMMSTTHSQMVPETLYVRREEEGLGRGGGGSWIGEDGGWKAEGSKKGRRREGEIAEHMTKEKCQNINNC